MVNFCPGFNVRHYMLYCTRVSGIWRKNTAAFWEQWRLLFHTQFYWKRKLMFLPTAANCKVQYCVIVLLLAVWGDGCVHICVCMYISTDIHIYAGGVCIYMYTHTCTYIHKKKELLLFYKYSNWVLANSFIYISCPDLLTVFPVMLQRMPSTEGEC